MVTLQKVELDENGADGDSVCELANLAREIWFEYWPDQIGEDQTRYMVEKFQTADAMAHDIADSGYEYFFIKDDAGKTVGYTAVLPERFAGREGDAQACVHGEAITPLHADRLFISKIYLLAEERGKHYASQVIELLANHARELGLTGMYLTVNKENVLGVRAYEGNGFDVIEALVTDIGEGFVMDDFIMARAV